MEIRSSEEKKCHYELLVSRYAHVLQDRRIMTSLMLLIL